MAVPHFEDLPLADRDRAWDGDAAEGRVRKWAKAEDGPNADYRRAHVWYDDTEPDNFGSYKMLIADVIDGHLTAVPRAVIAAAGVMQGARGGVNIDDDDAGRVRGHLARYYMKMDDTPPWET